MKKYLKRIIISVAIFFIVLTGVVAYGLYLMEIEDRYGDLQKVYFESETGDIVLNNINGEVGFLQFDNRRMFVKTETKTYHIEDWLDPKNKFIYNTDIYRGCDDFNFSNINSENLSELLNTGKIKAILHFEVKY